MRHLYEYDQIEIQHKIDTLIDTLKSRLLPTFNSIETEAKEIEEKRLEDLSKWFNPDYMDESDLYDDAFHKGVDHYIVQNSMKKEFLKSAATWLFHLFEKNCTYIFETEDGDQKKQILAELSIETEKGSNWYKCNHELRNLANAIKHGKGRSFNDLKQEKPDLFQGTMSVLSDVEIEITIENIEDYVVEMKNFWNCLFNKCLQ